jgi:hypothetical protein
MNFSTIIGSTITATIITNSFGSISTLAASTISSINTDTKALTFSSITMKSSVLHHIDEWSLPVSSIIITIGGVDYMIPVIPV